jgi:hypothetical protein
MTMVSPNLVMIALHELGLGGGRGSLRPPTRKVPNYDSGWSEVARVHLSMPAAEAVVERSSNCGHFKTISCVHMPIEFRPTFN